jgi:hypothetical protein
LLVVVQVVLMLVQVVVLADIEILYQVNYQVEALLLKHQQLLAQALYIQLLLVQVGLEQQTLMEQVVQHLQYWDLMYQSVL